MFAMIMKDTAATLKAWETRRRNAKAPDSSGGKWEGSLEEGLTSSPEVRATITKAMHDLSDAYPSLRAINVVSGDTLSGSDIFATKSNNSIIFNKEKLNEKGFISKLEKDWEGCRVDSSIYGVVVHEAGHVLDRQVLSDLGSKKYNKLIYDHEASMNGEKQTTPYGMENHAEFMAESFAAHFQKKPPAGVHPDIGKLIMTTANTLWDQLDKIVKKMTITFSPEALSRSKVRKNMTSFAKILKTTLPSPLQQAEEGDTLEGNPQLCTSCYWRREGGLTCEAFPGGIPPAITLGVFDHHAHYEDDDFNDNGLTYEPDTPPA